MRDDAELSSESTCQLWGQNYLLLNKAHLKKIEECEYCPQKKKMAYILNQENDFHGIIEDFKGVLNMSGH